MDSLSIASIQLAAESFSFASWLIFGVVVAFAAVLGFTSHERSKT